MADKKLSDFTSIEKANVLDFAVLYKENGNLRNGKLAISKLDQYYDSIYLNKTSASGTYLTKSDANNTYLNKIDASNTYLDKTSASNTYLPKIDASNTYLTKSDATDTYLTKTDATDTYLNKDTVIFNLLDYKWSDHVLNDIRWLNGDTFSWQSGLIYKTVYNHLKNDYENTPYIPYQEFNVSKPESLGSYNWDKIAINDNGKIVALSTWYDTPDECHYISTSVDGLTWTTPIKTSDTELWNYHYDLLSSDGNKFIIIGYNNETDNVCVSTSVDGEMWSTPVDVYEISLHSEYHWNGIYYDGEKFIILMMPKESTGYISTSIDGLTWTTPTEISPVNHNYNNVGIAYNGEYYVIPDGNYVYTSNNLTNWTPHKINGIPLISSDIIYDGEKFISKIENQYNVTFAISYDGISWKSKSYKDLKTEVNDIWTNMLYNEGHICMISYKGYYANGSDTKFTKETIGLHTISYCLTKDGHKICLPDQEAIIENIYRESGNAWYYILDIENTRFKLPRINQHGQIVESYTDGTIWYRLYSDGWIEQGGYSKRGNTTTNITYIKEFIDTNYNLQMSVKHASNIDGRPPVISNPSTTGFTATIATAYEGFYWKACGYAKEYTSNDSQKYLYFYVGKFSKLAVEETAGLNTELFNNKADRNLDNISSNIDFVIDYYHNGSDWYRLYKSGWVEQGGVCSVTKDTSSTVNLPIQMANSNYSVLVTQNHSLIGTTSSGEITISDKLSESFNLNYGKDVASEVCWQVSGLSNGN